MRFSCDKDIILKEIIVAQELTASRNAISILSNVLLEAEDNSLNIKATDLKVSFETQIPVNVDVSGLTTVFCDKLLSILRTLPSGEVKFTLNENGYFIIESGENISFRLHSITADKFPEIPELEEKEYFSIPQQDFIEMISQTVFAVSDDETRYYMNGIYLEKDDKRLVMVATDARRLSFIAKDFNGDIQDFKGIIIPTKALNLVKKLASGEGELQLAIAEKTLFIRFDNQEVTSALIEGSFPTYTRAIPESYDFIIKVKKMDLLDAIKRVSLLADKNSRRVFMKTSNNSINLSSEESDIGIAEEKIDCVYEGPDSVFSLNHVYLSEPLKAIKEEEVIFKFTDTKKALTLISVPESTFFHIIMPIQKG